MIDHELRCPECRNNFLGYTCYTSHNTPPNPENMFKKKHDCCCFGGRRYRLMNDVLEEYVNGIWKKANLYNGLTFNGPYVATYFYCECGFYSEDESAFLNNYTISQIEEKVYKNGNKYIGQFKNGKREGYGIMLFANGGRYEGNWKDNLAHGKGIEYYENGDRYEGNYYEDEEDGPGVYYYKNGDRIMGNYKNGKKIGKHVKLCSNGEIQVINFDN
jgi:hypothetical protein